MDEHRLSPKVCLEARVYLSLTHLIAASDLTLAEKGPQTPVLAEESTKPVWGPDLIDQVSMFIFGTIHTAEGIQINGFTVKRALPNFRRFLTDSDKIAALSSNLAYYVINPATKGRAGSVNSPMLLCHAYPI